MAGNILIPCVTALLMFPSHVWTNEATDLYKLVEDFWSWRMSEFPEFATKTGVTTYNGKLDSFAHARFIVRKEACSDFLVRLNRIDRLQLDGNDKTTYDVLKDNLQTYVDGYEWREYGMLNPINFLEGSQVNFQDLVSSTPFKAIDDYYNYITRLRSLPTQLSEQIELMKRSILLHTTNHNVSMVAVASQINDVFNRSVEDLDIYTPFKETLTNLTNIEDEDKDQLRITAKDVLSTLVIPAFQNLSRFIVDEYIPNCRSSYGVDSFPDGANYYKACLKWHMSIVMAPNDIYQKGIDEVERLKTEMLNIMKNTGFNGTTLVQFFDFLRNDPRFYKSTGAEILQTYDDIVFKRIRPGIKPMFNIAKDYPLLVEPMKFDGLAAKYSPPSGDGSKPGILQINLRHPDKRATFEMPPLSLHEAEPGHHIQINYMMRGDNPEFRKHTELNKYFSCPFQMPVYTIYTEGWAMYAESLGLEIAGVFKDDYELFGKYSSEMFRACRLVVDTGIHSMGWSRDQAINYLAEHTFNLRSQLALEVDRYITWPGQACAYTIGQLKIQELRKKAETALGKQFKLPDYHDVVLGVGPVPLGILEGAVDDWIKKQNTSNGSNQVPVFWLLFLSSTLVWLYMRGFQVAVAACQKRQC